jgi:hypothetical protein
MNQPQREPDVPIFDSSDTVLLIVDGGGDTTVRPTDPQLREQIERWQQRRRENLLDDRCSIKPEILKKMREAAERLGISEGDLICEGFNLLLHKYRDKLGDLLAPQPPGDAAKPENGPPSK